MGHSCNMKSICKHPIIYTHGTVTIELLCQKHTASLSKEKTSQAHGYYNDVYLKMWGVQMLPDS